MKNNSSKVKKLVEDQNSEKQSKALKLLVATLTLLAAAAVIVAQTDEGPKDSARKSVLVTAVVHDSRSRSIAEKLRPEDFVVKEDKISQEMIGAAKATNRPIALAVLIQDNLVIRVNNELRGIRNFIRGLPKDSVAMTASISTTGFRVRMDFTADLEAAAKSIRVVPGSRFDAPYSPYLQIKNAASRFEGQPQKRRMILVVTDGFDNSNGTGRGFGFFSAYLDTALREAQQNGVAIYPVYAPAAGKSRRYRRAVNSAQGSLLKLANDTGGEAFFSGSDFVTFSPYFKELSEILNNQWLLTYRSSNLKPGYRNIEVVTDFDIHLHHPAGYRVMKKKGD